MINIILKTAIIYFVILIAMRVMGQKLSGQLQPYELVITLIIAEVASTPMDSPGTPLLFGLVPALTLIVLYAIISFISLKSKRVRALISGTPSILIHNGQIKYQELKKIGYNMNDLLEQLRISGITDISSIHYAVLETNGQLSVIPFSKYAPVTPMDLKITPSDPSFFSAIVLDSAMDASSIDRLGIDKQKLQRLLGTLGYDNPKKLLVVMVSDKGDLFLQDKTGQTRSLSVGKENLYV